MERTALRGRLTWQTAAVTSVTRETASVVTITLDPLAYICGPTSFVEAAAAGLVGLGYPPQRVKTERFGSTGGR